MCADLEHATRCGGPLVMALLSEVLSALSIWGICPCRHSIARFGEIYSKQNRPLHLSVFSPVGRLSPFLHFQLSSKTGVISLAFYRCADSRLLDNHNLTKLHIYMMRLSKLWSKCRYHHGWMPTQVNFNCIDGKSSPTSGSQVLGH